MNETLNAATQFPLPDPSAPGGLSSALIWSGKNAGLREETARSWTAGFELAPRRWLGLSLAATYFDIDFTDRLNTPAFSFDLLSNPLFTNFVIRNPSAAQVAMVCGRAPQSAFPVGCPVGPVNAIVDLRLRNDARLLTRGFDVIAKYVHESPLGVLSFDLNGTYIIDFATAASTGQRLVDRVSTQSFPVDLRLRGSAGWRRGGLDITAFGNFWNHYRDTASLPMREVTSLTTFDLNVAYTLAREKAWGLGETTFALSAQNLFDRDAPFLNNGAAVIGYDQENADIIGRFVSVTIRQNW
jgi:iron complex outermembrane receptor protein